MIFEETKIKGCFIAKRTIPRDERGYFSRLVDVNEFVERGLASQFVQISASKNYRKGTLRGMHMQVGDSAEEKYIACVEGEVFDVCLDMRENSPTYLEYTYAVLSEENGTAILIPKGCAHGFISLKDDSQLIYFMTSPHDASAERGFMWNDPAFSISWPMEPLIVSEKDSNWPLFQKEINV